MAHIVADNTDVAVGKRLALAAVGMAVDSRGKKIVGTGRH